MNDATAVVIIVIATYIFFGVVIYWALEKE